MLSILGSPKTLCDGVTRRDMLWAGGLGLLGVGLEGFLRLRDAQASSPDRSSPNRSAGFGRAKSCILLYLYGSPSQLELADMKPDAPAEIRGELQPIRSSQPGCDVCELFPRLAQVMDRMTVVRSMTHPYPIHGVAYATTGVPTTDIPMELNPRDGRHWPFIGSVVDYLERQNPARRRREMPSNIALPFPFSSRRSGEVPRAGPYAAFLGNAFNPLWTDFHGQANRTIVKTLNNETLEVAEPYVGITPESGFELASSSGIVPDLTLDRLDRRRSLLEQFDQARTQVDRSDAGRNLDRYRSTAYDLIGSSKLREALDIGREPRSVRDTYGMTIFGQASLAARRLVEAGSRFVTVFWDEYGLAGSGWDTHWEHYPRMRNELAPGLDWGLSGLIRDLDQRGMLDETLVLVLSEHGRTPRLNNARGGGRDHWSEAYTCLFAGGGIARGRVVGRTDRHAATVTERPVSPKDILATTYHLLGIDPETHLTDRTGRPMPLVQNAAVVGELME
ncbi:MAG: DUF1501 domain-containing protein [Planctomycetes bacterium]|nr:DUF1501 domain-containing protein [Planctomycetota bacterium]